MDKITEMRLRPASLFYGAFWLGAEECYGMLDPFHGMTMEEIREAVRKAQEELCDSGWAEMDSAGEFQIKADARPLLEIFALCEAFLSMEQRQGKNIQKLLVYEKDGEEAWVTEEGDGLLLRLSTASQREALLGKWCQEADGEDFTEPEEPPKGFGITVPELSEIRRLISDNRREEAGEKLLAVCEDERICQGILQGLEGNSNQLAVACTDFRTRRAAAIFTLTWEKDTIFLQNQPDRYTESWNLWAEPRSRRGARLLHGMRETMEREEENP